MALLYVDQLELKDNAVIGRFDFNVPLNKDLSIADTTRLDEALPTIKHILDAGAKKLILMSHLGRPKGSKEAKYSLAPVAEYLAEKLGEEIVLTESATDSGIKTLLNLSKNRIILLENLRFHPEEEKNDPEFAKKLASYADIYINDAFGTSHREHASTYGIVAFFSKGKYGAGFLIKKEISSLDRLVQKPSHPYVGVLGGAKVADKIKIIENLLPKVEHLLIGGAMAYPFLKAAGRQVGKSLCSDEDVALAKKLLATPSAKKLVLPVDHIVSTTFDGAPESCNSTDIEQTKMGLDIGPRTIASYQSYLSSAKTVFWNGPMGIFENPHYAKGTESIAKTLSQLTGAFTLVGGGDSVNAINKFNLASKISHVSTGGGASLEYIEHGTLPGIKALKFGLN